MGTFSRYLLLQLPGWLLAGVVVVGLWQWAGLSAWLAAGLFLLWVAKDLLFYPFVRRAYEPDTRTGAERLVGCRGVARQRLAPGGYVQLRGELWRAEIEPEGHPIPRGSPVRVVAARRLTLIVVADPEGDAGP